MVIKSQSDASNMSDNFSGSDVIGTDSDAEHVNADESLTFLSKRNKKQEVTSVVSAKSKTSQCQRT